jgi:ABC-type transport system involved in multi-copper enzyme maturation permease subunit
MSTEFVTIDKTRPGIPMTRLVKVELRKLVDTRAGFWLLLSIGIVTALVVVIQQWVVAAQDMHITYGDIAQAMATPMGIFLPVLGIMSVTSEWGQRTGLVTFTLEPRRDRIVAAKLISGVITAIASVALALLLGVLGNLAYGGLTGHDVVWDISTMAVFGILLAWVIGLLTGFAFGMLLMNTAAAIVLFFIYSFVLPGLLEWGYQTVGWIHDIRPWIDFSDAQIPLYDATMTGKDWAQFVLSGAVWFVLPLGIGIWRLLKSEVK